MPHNSDAIAGALYNIATNKITIKKSVYSIHGYITAVLRDILHWLPFQLYSGLQTKFPVMKFKVHTTYKLV